MVERTTITFGLPIIIIMIIIIKRYRVAAPVPYI